MSFSTFIERVLGKHNLQLPKWEQKSWAPGDMEASLAKMLTYAEENATAAMNWYWDKKRWKAITSRACRLACILFTATAAMIPILGATGWFAPENADQTLWALKLNQAGYLSLGFAALALALDRFMSGSSSWMRYVSTATSIQTALEEFRFDWDKLRAPLAGKAPTSQEVLTLINRIEEFNAAVRALVEGETSAWVAEFQKNLADMEKSTAAAVEAARANVQAAQKAADDERKAAHQKAEEERKATEQKAEDERKAALPGGIELTLQNAVEIDSEGYEVFVDTERRKAGVLSATCAVLGIAPGLHELEVRARIGGAPAHGSAGVTVAPGAFTKVALQLTRQRAAGQIT